MNYAVERVYLRCVGVIPLLVTIATGAVYIIAVLLFVTALAPNSASASDTASQHANAAYFRAVEVNGVEVAYRDLARQKT